MKNNKISFRFFVLISVLILVSVCCLGCIGTEQTGDAIYLKKMGPADMMSQFNSGDIDGFIAWEPYNAELVVNGDGKYLVQSGTVWPNHPCCVVAVMDTFTDESAIKAVVWAHIKATEFINNPANEGAVTQYAMDFTGKDEAVVKEGMNNIKFTEYPDETEVKTYYQKLDQNKILKKTVGELGYASEDAFFGDFLMKTYYDEVKAELDSDSSWMPEKVSNTTNVRLAYLIADLHQLAMYAARQEGYYEDVGLIEGENLVIKPPYANGPAEMEGFKNGDIDVGYLGGAPATLKRINDDTKIRIIAGVNNEGSAIVVGKDSGIDSLSDLKGKTIATPGFGTVQDFIVRMIAEQIGTSVELAA